MSEDQSLVHFGNYMLFRIHFHVFFSKVNNTSPKLNEKLRVSFSPINNCNFSELLTK